jgi:hypothetical protein
VSGNTTGSTHTPLLQTRARTAKNQSPATIDEIDDDNNNVVSDPANGDVPEDPLQLDLSKLIGEVAFDETIAIDGTRLFLVRHTP